MKRPATIGAAVCALILTASYIVNAMDRSVFPQFVRAINHELHFSLAQGGLLSTIFALGIGLGGIPTGYLLDRWSRKSVAIVGIAIYSFFTIVTVMALGFWDMLAYRALSGVGEAMQQTALFTIFGAYFFRQRTLALGVLNVAYGIGAFIGPILGVRLEMASGGHWRYPMVVFALIGFVFCVLIALLVARGFSEVREPEAPRRVLISTVELPPGLFNRNVTLVSLTNVVVGLATFGYVGLYPTFLQTVLHFTHGQAGFAASLYGIGAIAGLPAGWLGDRLRQRWVILGSLVGTMITLYLMFEVATLPWQQDVLSCLQGIFGSGFLFVNIYALTQRSARPEYAGRASGIASSAHYLPAAFAGLLFGTLAKSFGWATAATLQLVLLSIVGIIAMLFVRDDQVSAPATLLP
ncbi:MAG TPA: MFS transporter [Candidatus Limnocylindria bacterium]|nr:MFS transporter [Candidatus Limnocylindria bacterium]